MKENRELFFKRIEPFLSPRSMRDVQLAYTLSKFAHRAQSRKELDEAGRPVRYFEHCRRVALVLIDEVQIPRPEMIISALMHDTLEDTKDITPDMLEHCFGTEVTTIVKTLSKIPKEGYIKRFMTSVDWRSYVIKGCDRLDNLRSLNMPEIPPEFRMRQALETRDVYYPLFDQMMCLMPSEYRVQIIGLVSKIHKATNDIINV